ncbi:MAG: methylmalonyl-CoA epimerase [Candidatus Eisenbacteria bacterium]|nr:methylmalonyl-CoA epimerase [Candidatus Latescibacterota bacterium]MBD3303226.1 methylmalonyl-CoA epimerase [Candidatus Eisenbacteria bacterium]
MAQRIDHIGVAVADLEAALRLYRDLLGLPLEKVEEVPDQKLISYHLGIGESRIELLVPTSPDSVIARYLEKRGAGIHHVALAVEDVDAERARLVAEGLVPIGEPSIGAEGKRIQFFHPRSTGGVLLEICG